MTCSFCFSLIFVLLSELVSGSLEQQTWSLNSVHAKLESNAKKVEKGLQLEGRSGQIPKQIAKHRELVYQRQAKTICETGFNAGHSAASWLRNSHPHSQYFGFDAGRMFHKYPEENFRLLRTLVPNGAERINVHFGDSTKTLPTFIKEVRGSFACELVHVDGGHFGDVPHADLWGFFEISNRDTLLIMDDLDCTATWCKKPNEVWKKAQVEGWVKELGCQHYAVNPTPKKGKFPRGFCWGRYNYEGKYSGYEAPRFGNRGVKLSGTLSTGKKAQLAGVTSSVQNKTSRFVSEEDSRSKHEEMSSNLDKEASRSPPLDVTGTSSGWEDKFQSSNTERSQSKLGETLYVLWPQLETIDFESFLCGMLSGSILLLLVLAIVPCGLVRKIQARWRGGSK